MSDLPKPGAEGAQGVYTGAEPNPIMAFLQQPRIMLLILAGWSMTSVLTQTFTARGLFMDNHNREIDGALGGLALSWEGIPLAVLYIYCARDPKRFPGIFFLALIQMGSLCAAQLYHWLVTDDYTFESIALPLIISTAIGGLVFLHLFARKDPEPVAGSQ